MNLKKRNKKIRNAIFVIVIFILTIYTIFKGQDLHSVLKIMVRTNPRYLILGVLGVFIYMWGESIIIHYLFKTLKIKTKKRTCFLYTGVGMLFCGITPSASGGQPAQIYYMHKDHIPVPVSTIVLMIVTITYKLVLVMIGLFVVFFQRGFVDQYLNDILPIFYLGVMLNVFCCIIMSLFVICPQLAKKVMMKLLGFLEHIHILKRKQSRTDKLATSMDQYSATSNYLKDHKKVIVNVILITFLQRLALFFVTWFVYKAFHLEGVSIYHVLMLQAVVSVSVDMLPLPGGMGISEQLFLQVFKSVFSGKLLLPGMILSRGIAYYVQILISAMLTLVAYITIVRKDRKYQKGEGESI